MEEKEDSGDEEKDEWSDERCHSSNNMRAMVLCVRVCGCIYTGMLWCMVCVGV